MNMSSNCLILSYVAVVSDNDGSAFITKAEFDSLKNNFQAQIDNYNQSIDSKIDGAIAAYLAGIKIEAGDNRLEVDWVAPFKETNLGILNCKYIDIINYLNSRICGRKSGVWVFTKVDPDNVGRLLLYDALVRTSADRTISGTDRASVTAEWINHKDEYNIVLPQFADSNVQYGRLLRANSGGGWSEQLSATAIPSGYQDGWYDWGAGRYIASYGNRDRDGTIGMTYTIVDEIWSDICGYPVICYQTGDCSRDDADQFLLGYPLLKATDGEGDVNFMYNSKENHPWAGVYGTYSTTGYNSGVKGDTARVYFAITDLTTGLVTQYLTPQDENFIHEWSSQPDNGWTVVTGHMRANQVLMLYMKPDKIGNAYGDRSYAWRIKMNFQNLNP